LKEEKMSDEYLWDRSGEPDSEVARLEELLGSYRFQEKPRRMAKARLVLAIAASVLVVAGAAVFWNNRSAGTRATGWLDSGKQIAEGQTIATGSGDSRVLRSELVGELRIDPNSRLKVLRGGEGEQRMALQVGTMHALIWAPPARFTVDTPSSRTVDLGCAYTLSVAGDGSGLVTVETGWVAFQAGALESFIPAGAACRTRPVAGPGIPYFLDASEKVRDGLAAFERTSGHQGLEEILSAVRPRDQLTLWHLVLRTSGGDRERVVSRFAGFAPGIDSAGLIRGDSAAIDAAWGTLGLGGTEWWRGWKHNW
jgi:hypothetical protein